MKKLNRDGYSSEEKKFIQYNLEILIAKNYTIFEDDNAPQYKYFISPPLLHNN